MKTTAIKQMTTEHRHIETVIKSLHDAVAALEKGQRLNIQKLRNVVEFLRVYADRRHHRREESAFFPILVKHGVPAQAWPLNGLNRQHQKGRALVTALAARITAYEQRQAGADTALSQTLQDISQLYQHHLSLEDATVFPMAEILVTDEDNRELLKKFAAFDRSIGSSTIERLEQFAGSLSLQAGTEVVL